MSNTLPTYAPPELREGVLYKRLLDWYPSHNQSPQLLKDLIEEYKRFWRMVLSYPHRRVVAPGPVMAVQRVHQFDSQLYFDDCMSYFRRFMRRGDLAWQGRTDYHGTHDTIMVYHDMFESDPPVAWIEMSDLVNLRKGNFTVIS